MDAVTTMIGAEPVADPEDRNERLGRLFDRHHLRLYRFALRMTRGEDDAADVVQEAFVRAARHPGRIPEDDQGAGAWLVRIVVNLLHDRHRREQVRHDYRIGYVPLPQRDLTDELGVRDEVRAAIATLPPRQRAVIVLYSLEERSIAEIASALRLTGVTVRWHLHTARKRLSRLLAHLRSASHE